jgi:hypothetical protein
MAPAAIPPISAKRKSGTPTKKMFPKKAPIPVITISENHIMNILRKEKPYLRMPTELDKASG